MTLDRATFHGKLTPDEAQALLRQLAHDKEQPGLVRMEASSALLSLREGRSVQSTMARFRRAIGLDSEKGAKRP